jgi:hypothetical protein
MNQLSWHPIRVVIHIGSGTQKYACGFGFQFNQGDFATIKKVNMAKNKQIEVKGTEITDYHL